MFVELRVCEEGEDVHLLPVRNGFRFGEVWLSLWRSVPLLFPVFIRRRQKRTSEAIRGLHGLRLSNSLRVTVSPTRFAVGRWLALFESPLARLQSTKFIFLGHCLGKDRR